MPRKAEDLTGKKFGRWTVIGREGADNQGRTTWLARCECGTERVVRSDGLRKYQSCGCLQKEKAIETGKTLHLRRRKVPSANKTHGMTGTKTYRAWNQMIQRCHNPKNPTYQRYGAMGVTVCDRWRESFENFLADMGECPSSDHTIDRKDSNGNYEPDNCRWLPSRLQSQGRKCVRRFPYAGDMLLLKEIAERTGIKYATLRFRIVERGWSVEKAVSTDPRLYHGHIEPKES